jgi:tRNA-splicing ligase RtcB
MESVIASERIPIKLWVSDQAWWFGDALQQAKNLANLPFAYKWIAIMADSHVGYGMPIGGVMATNEVIVPNAVGVDIGCGMVAVKTSIREISKEQLQLILRDMRANIPTGFNHRDESQVWEGFGRAPDIPVIQEELGSAKRQLGTLGGGNHFIEIQQDEQGFVWLMIHSGSRNFGYKTAKTYHDLAKEMCQKWQADIPTPDLAFLPMDSDFGQEYFVAMNYALDFAEANRALMMDWSKVVFSNIVGVPCDFEEVANIHHNYAAREHHFGKNVLVHRKGATKATANTIGIIPGSMGTSSYIVRGLGNEDSFQSCSHGAGRTMGRAQAKRKLDLTKEQAKMHKIVGGPRNIGDLDEAPGAYKDIDEVMANQTDLVEVLVKLTPLASMKG